MPGENDLRLLLERLEQLEEVVYELRQRVGELEGLNGRLEKQCIRSDDGRSGGNT